MLREKFLFSGSVEAISIYDTDDAFFKEIDSSIRKNCHKLQDVNVYLIQFENFTQDLMMLMGNLMKFKLRLPSFMKNPAPVAKV